MTTTGDRGHGLLEQDHNHPVKIGGQAVTGIPDQVADAARVRAWFDQRGRQFVVMEAEETTTVAFVNATASGNTQLVAAVVGKKIRVTRIRATNKGAADIEVKFQSDTTDITATDMLASLGGGYTDSACQGWVMETASGEALNINLAALGNVGCTVTFKEA